VIWNASKICGSICLQRECIFYYNIFYI
jgi:hypothetical protein